MVRKDGGSERKREGEKSVCSFMSIYWASVARVLWEREIGKERKMINRRRKR